MSKDYDEARDLFYSSPLHKDGVNDFAGIVTGASVIFSERKQNEATALVNELGLVLQNILRELSNDPALLNKVFGSKEAEEVWNCEFALSKAVRELQVAKESAILFNKFLQMVREPRYREQGDRENPSSLYPGNLES